MSIIIRAATAADQQTITALVRGAKINPMRLEWPNFLVAERIENDASHIVGVGQLRPHGDGTLELASLVVIPEEQGRGAGGELVQTLIRKANGALYLMCDSGKVTYYQRFGFYELKIPKTMPRSLRRFYRVASLLEGLFSLFRVKSFHLAIMAYPGLGSM